MKKIKQFIFFSLALFFIVGLLNFIIDPYEIYRVPKFRNSVYSFSSHLKAGLIKNRQYDSIVLGSSMTQNFIINEVEDSLSYKKVLKLSEGGANISEIFTILKASLRTKKVKNILMGVDINSFSRLKNKLPLYLYEDSRILDLKYLLSLNTILDSLVIFGAHIMLNPNHILFQYNYMFQWQHKSPKSDFLAKKVLNEYRKRNVNVGNYKDIQKAQKEQKENIHKLAKIVQENPNINFTFFYPPYSILFYKTMNTEALSSFMDIKKYFNQKISKFQNVKIYDFQDAFEIISNLNLYKDISHYHQKINTWMLKQIKFDNFRIRSLDLNRSDIFQDYIIKYQIPEM